MCDIPIAISTFSRLYFFQVGTFLVLILILNAVCGGVLFWCGGGGGLYVGSGGGRWM